MSVCVRVCCRGVGAASTERGLKEAVEAKSSVALASSHNPRILAAAFHVVAVWSKPPCTWDITTVAERVINAVVRRADKSALAVIAALDCMVSLLVNYPSKAQKLAELITAGRLFEVALRMADAPKVVRSAALLLRHRTCLDGRGVSRSRVERECSSQICQ